LEKKVKSTEQPNNLRPITLTNFNLKLKTKTLVNRMSKVQDKINLESQTAEIPV
jgi:hypothetical protein